MKRPLALLVCAAALALAGGPVAATPVRAGIETARRRVYPALVNITVVTRYFTGGRAQRGPAGGSGVIVTPRGHVLTNFHVAGHTTRILCTLTSGEVLRADVVTHDPLTDLSVLKLRPRRGSEPRAFPYAPLGSSAALRVGDQVAAMGNPLMLSSSVTLGIVSNTKRIFTSFGESEAETMQLDTGEETGLFTRWIQHDALILPGNSGGPLVNMRGEVVGINELGSSGVGFAIPSDIARQVLNEALAHGTLRRGWLGITLLPVDKLGRRNGALVGGVLPGTPAARAGVQAGDVLLAVNGQPVEARFSEQVPVVYQRVAALPAGRPARLTLLRGGRTVVAAPTVARMEKSVGDEREIRRMGVTVQEITGMMALTRHLPLGNGVLVTGVRAGFPFEAAEPKVAAGDVITAVNGKPTRTPDALAKALDVRPGKSLSVTCLRDEEQIVSFVKNEEDKSGEEGGELPRAWLGVRTQVVTPDIAEALGASDASGFRITEVYPGTAAAKAGLKVGDILTSLNGDELSASRTQDAQDLKRAIEELSVGEVAKLGVLRGGKATEVSVPLEEPPASGDKAKRSKQLDFEFAVRELSPMDRLDHSWMRGQQGVLVTDVTSGGWAQMGGLRTDDLILSMDGRKVASVADFDKAMAAILKSRPEVVRLFVRRDYQTDFVFVEPDWPSPQGSASGSRKPAQTSVRGTRRHTKGR